MQLAAFVFITQKLCVHRVFLVQLPTLKPCSRDVWWLLHVLRPCTDLLPNAIIE